MEMYDMGSAGHLTRAGSETALTERQKELQADPKVFTLF